MQPSVPARTYSECPQSSTWCGSLVVVPVSLSPGFRCWLQMPCIVQSVTEQLLLCDTLCYIICHDSTTSQSSVHGIRTPRKRLCGGLALPDWFEPRTCHGDHWTSRHSNKYLQNHVTLFSKCFIFVHIDNYSKSMYIDEIICQFVACFLHIKLQE